ncbi:MAG TPA: VWA domain-containing protein [Chitinophagaceae bacterium]|nr:VWA domain-containing protein [Chitinophagaceae bacterium]
MLRFQHPQYFWLLLPGVVLAALYWLQWRHRRRIMRQLGTEDRIQKLMPGFSATRFHWKAALFLLAFIIGVIGIANLQSGARTEKVERKGIDVMIALDVSKSMLATDMSPNRLERARQLIARLIEKLSNDRIGLVLFAGRAYVSVPLTIDASALKMNLETASPALVPTQGTVLGEALRMARESFNSKETKYKSIILLSDGEDHDESAMDEVKQAVSEGIMINTVGIGSPEGSYITDPETGERKTDEEGNEVISKLNEKELQDIASAGQGVYVRMTNPDITASTLEKQVNSTEQKNFGDALFADYNSYFQYFLAISFVLLLIEFILPERKKIQVA